MPKKRKRNDYEEEDETVPLEQEYAHDVQAKAANKKRTIDLLPIKTKKGEVITRSTEVEFDDETFQQSGDEHDDEDDENAEQVEVDSDDEVLNDTNVTLHPTFLWHSTHLSIRFILAFVRVTGAEQRKSDLNG